MSMVQAKGRDHSKQVLHQKGWSDPPGIIESFRFQDEDDCENHFFFFFFQKNFKSNLGLRSHPRP